MSEEISALGSLPDGIEQAKRQTMIWHNWLKPHMEKIRYSQELARRMQDRVHYVHPASETTEGLDDGLKICLSAAAACSGGQSPYYAP
eukprot:10586648-Karenia_brevis.AAC.1